MFNVHFLFPITICSKLVWRLWNLLYEFGKYDRSWPQPAMHLPSNARIPSALSHDVPLEFANIRLLYARIYVKLRGIDNGRWKKKKKIEARKRLKKLGAGSIETNKLTAHFSLPIQFITSVMHNVTVMFYQIVANIRKIVWRRQRKCRRSVFSPFKIKFPVWCHADVTCRSGSRRVIKFIHPLQCKYKKKKISFRTTESCTSQSECIAQSLNVRETEPASTYICIWQYSICQTVSNRWQGKTFNWYGYGISNYQLEISSRIN